jgi:Transglutaminase-like superfamily
VYLATLCAVCAAEPDDTIWYAVLDDNGAQIGYASTAVTRREGGREIVDTQQIDVSETAGHTTNMVWRTTLTEDAAGRAVSIVSYSQAGRSSGRTEAHITGDKAEITRVTDIGRRTVVVALPPNVRFDTGDRLFSTWNRATALPLEFDNFNVDAMAVEHIVFRPVPTMPGDPPGTTAVLRNTYEGKELRGVARVVIDAQGRIAEVMMPLFGGGVTIRAADRSRALDSHSPLRVFPGVTMKSPFRIPSSAAQGHIRYHFAFRDGIVFDMPQTGEQRVKADQGGITVDICEGCGSGLASDAETLADALKPTIWLQSDAPQIRELVEPVKELPTDTAKMAMLIKLAKPYLGKVDYVGHYSALEMMARKSGDCTEAAVLLAALARAAGIPARVANGVVYTQVRYHGVSNAFMPHSWVIAYADGKWRSFDLALDKFDSTHIAVTVGDGDEHSMLAARQLSGLLRWDSIAEVRPAPGSSPAPVN